MIRSRSGWCTLVMLASLPAMAHAKTYRYAGGPQPQPDTTLSVAVPEIEEVVRSRGPKVPLTNLQMLTMV